MDRAGWTKSWQKVNTYNGLSETLPVWECEMHYGSASVVQHGSAGVFWSADGRDGEVGGEKVSTVEAGMVAAERFLAAHAQIPGQLSLFDAL